MTTSTLPHPVQRRVHSNTNSKGNLGKSFEIEFRACWMDSKVIPWSGSDLDDRHRTFSDKHPDEVKSYKIGNDLESRETFQTIFRGILQDQTEVHVLDVRAQMDELFIDAVEAYDFLTLCSKHGIRMTQFMFPTDELASMANFAQLIKFGAGVVDFVIVKNPAKTKGKLFYGSRMEQTLRELGAKMITLPIINYSTLRVMEAAENKEGRGISLAEFASEESGFLDELMLQEIQSALGLMYTQYNSIADLLLPSERAESIKASVVQNSLKEMHPKTKGRGLELNFGT